MLLAPYLVLVSGVERDLCNLVVLFSHFRDISAAQLDTLEQSRLRGVTGYVSLAEEDGERRTLITVVLLQSVWVYACYCPSQVTTTWQRLLLMNRTSN